ncbi:hypothetical protein B0H13DRAFT_2419573 [Mycena leptocephala]|nr:hypothetical protein B0H13DRAFT_2419573 [Mycena leptocephala]
MGNRCAETGCRGEKEKDGVAVFFDPLLNLYTGGLSPPPTPGFGPETLDPSKVTRYELATFHSPLCSQRWSKALPDDATLAGIAAFYWSWHEILYVALDSRFSLVFILRRSILATMASNFATCGWRLASYPRSRLDAEYCGGDRLGAALVLVPSPGVLLSWKWTSTFEASVDPLADAEKKNARSKVLDGDERRRERCIRRQKAKQMDPDACSVRRADNVHEPLGCCRIHARSLWLRQRRHVTVEQQRDSIYFGTINIGTPMGLKMTTSLGCNRLMLSWTLVHPISGSQTPTVPIATDKRRSSDLIIQVVCAAGKPQRVCYLCLWASGWFELDR